MGQDHSPKPAPRGPVLDELLIDAEADDAELQPPARLPRPWLLLLGLVLGPLMEENFRRALLLARGDFTVFLTRPLSLGLLLAAAALVVIVALPAVKKTREEAFVEE
mgnify:CR=1 FL=1